MNRIIFFGHIGSDAPGWYIGPDGKIHKVPGWNPEQFHDVQQAVSALRSLAQIKSPAVTHVVAAQHEFVNKELGAHLEKGDVVVLG